VPKEALHRVATQKRAGGATESSGGSSRAGSAGSTGSAGGAGSASGGTEVPSVPAPTTGSDSPPKVEVKVGDKKVDANLGSLDVDKTVETLLPDPQLP
jgi:hypothetical protein